MSETTITVRDAERRHGADGYRVAVDGESTTRLVADHAAKPARVGRTICPHPYGSHWCGLLHVPDPDSYADL